MSKKAPGAGCLATAAPDAEWNTQRHSQAYFNMLNVSWLSFLLLKIIFNKKEENPNLKKQLSKRQNSDNTILGFTRKCRKPKKYGVLRVWDSKEIMDFFESAVGVLQTLVVALGAGLGVWGVVNLMEGYGNDNPGAKSQGMKQLMAGGGVALIGTQLIPLLTDLFTTTTT